eukprot:TRINITY_DN19759_c0_g1_i1.p1 TRINITY_DN19759_c0_g1~~TRINITY_DN19759_c0_g1_i1.p1  ORF type:complete len:442 (-),score=85.82 TRINITY_DN19759_c0_g1_i1:235-1560(-)
MDEVLAAPPALLPALDQSGAIRPFGPSSPGPASARRSPLGCRASSKNGGGSRPTTRGSVRTAASSPPRTAWQSSRPSSRASAATPLDPGFSPVGFGPAAGPDRGRLEEAYNWSHANMQYLPNAAREEAERAIRAAREEASEWRARAAELERKLEESESKRVEAETEKWRRVKETHASMDQCVEDCDARITVVERLLESERLEHAMEVARLEHLVSCMREECESRVQTTEWHRDETVRHAEAQRREAEAAAGTAKQRAIADIEECRKRCANRIEEMRKETEERVRSALEEKQTEVERMRAELESEREKLRRDLQLGHKRQLDAENEASRHVRAMESNNDEWRMAKEAEFDGKNRSLQEQIQVQRRQHAYFEEQNKEKLELERRMHLKTMERTIGLVSQRLHLGMGGENGELPEAHSDWWTTLGMSDLDWQERPPPPEWPTLN